MITKIEFVNDKAEPIASLHVDFMIAVGLSGFVDVIASHSLVRAGAELRKVSLKRIHLMG